MPTDHVLCHMATASAEHATGIPDQLLTAISRVESGRADPATGRLQSWPWTINVEGVGHFYDSKAEAVGAVAAFETQGARSIDVGCMQINLKQHPDAFASLQDAFDPAINALYAAHFLTGLFQQTGSWPHAAAAYHSQTPELGRDYQNQVLQMWAEGDAPTTITQSGKPRALASASDSNSPASNGSASGSPFGAGEVASVTHYGPRPTILSAGLGRGLSDYRQRPIAVASRMLLPQHF